jgi:hypothetical protein
MLWETTAGSKKNAVKKRVELSSALAKDGSVT